MSAAKISAFSGSANQIALILYPDHRDKDSCLHGVEEISLLENAQTSVKRVTYETAWMLCFFNRILAEWESDYPRKWRGRFSE